MQLVLTENRHLRIASFTIFYVAQGLPIGLLMIAIPAWLAGAGATATEIASYVSLAGLPWGLKLFAGPIMDRFSHLSVDHCLLLFSGRPDGLYFVYRAAYERLLGESCRDAICDLHGLVKPV